MGIASKTGIVLILSLSFLLNTAILQTDMVSSSEDARAGHEGAGIELSAALFRMELRSGPSAEDPILCVIPEGAAPQYIHAAQNGWTFVSYDGQTGYLPDQKTADALGETHPERTESPLYGNPGEAHAIPEDNEVNLPGSVSYGTRNIPQLKTTTVYYSLNDLELFDGTGSGRSRLLVVPKGTHLISLEESEGWHQVSYKEVHGWVRASHLESSEVNMVDGIIIVNKGYGLPKDFSPGRNPEAYDAFMQMKQAASKEGITLRLSTTYRKYSAQQHIYRTYQDRVGKDRADTYSARAGYSEHQTGLAFDIGGANPDFRLKQSLGTMKEGLWMAEHAPSYGFILRYPKGKQEMTGYMYEPWHFRYVGVALALRITKSGLCLDEYLGVVAPDYAAEP